MSKLNKLLSILAGPALVLPLVSCGGSAHDSTEIYYLVAVKYAYLLPDDRNRGPLPLSLGDRALCYGLSGAVVVLGIFPAALYRFAERAAQLLP